MTTLASSTPATLRRRARTLADLGYNPEFLSVLTRAADELEARGRYDTEGEAFVLETIADNRRLRSALVNVFGTLKPTLLGKDHEHLDKIRRALAATREPGRGRRILTIEVLGEQTRDEIHAAARGAVDAHFDSVDAARSTSAATDDAQADDPPARVR